MRNIVWSALGMGLVCSLGAMDVLEEQTKVQEALEKKLYGIQLWKGYIEKNKFSSDTYFNSKESYDLIQSILDLDKESEELSSDTLKLMELLSKKCSYIFNRKRFEKNSPYYTGDNVISTILKEENLSSVKKVQTMRALLRYSKKIAPEEYYVWLLQVVNASDPLLMFYFLDESFSGFMRQDMFSEIARLTYRVHEDKRESLSIIHKFLIAVETFYNENISYCSSHSSGKDVQDMIQFFKQIRLWLYEFLASPANINYMIDAYVHTYWDYLNYCFTRGKVGVGYDIMQGILRTENLETEKKIKMLRTCMFCAHQQGCLRRLLAYNGYQLVEDVAKSPSKDLLANMVQLYDNGETNLLIGLLLETDEKPQKTTKKEEDRLKKITQRITILLNTLSKEERHALLNPKQQKLPLTVCCRGPNNIELFKLLVNKGACLWQTDSFSGKEWNLYFNPCSFALFMKEKSINDRVVGLDMSERWLYLQYCIKKTKEYGKKVPGALHTLLNKKGLISPLAIALMDEEDKDMVFAHYLLKNGARYDYVDRLNRNILSSFVLDTFFDHDERVTGIRRLFELCDNIAFLFGQAGTYPDEQIEALIRFLEKSERKDKAACLYVLLKSLTEEQYEKVRSNVKKTMMTSKVMKKIDKSQEDFKMRYQESRKSNVRYADLMICNEKTPLYKRDKYANLL